MAAGPDRGPFCLVEAIETLDRCSDPKGFSFDFAACRLSGAGWPEKACTSSVASGLTLDSPRVGTDGSKDQQMRHCTPATVQSVGYTKKCRKSGSVGVADRKISEKFQKAAAPYQDACVRIVGDSTADSVPAKGLASANSDRITWISKRPEAAMQGFTKIRLGPSTGFRIIYIDW